MGLSLVDYMGGTYLALALVSGVLAARSTGRGRDVDVNLFDTALFNFSYLGAWALNGDYTPERLPRSAPSPPWSPASSTGPAMAGST